MKKYFDPYKRHLTLGGSVPYHATKTAAQLTGFAIRCLRNYTPSIEKERYLDIGCGNGHLTRIIAPYFKEAVGIDIRIAKDRKSNIKFLKASADHIAYNNDTFDLITFFEVLEHVNDLQKSIGEAIRVSKISGIIVVTVPNVFFPIETHGVRLAGRTIKKKVPLLPYIPPLHRRFALARNFSVSQLDRYFYNLGARPIGKPVYIAPQLERQIRKDCSYQNKILSRLRPPLNHIVKAPIIGTLFGVSVGRVYQKSKVGS